MLVVILNNVKNLISIGRCLPTVCFAIASLSMTIDFLHSPF